MSEYKHGGTREDGYVLNGYYTLKDGTKREHWLSPEAWAKKCANRRAVARESARKARQNPANREYQREYQRAYSRVQRVEKPELFLYRGAKTRAKKFGLDFNIRVEDIVIPEYCPVLGIKIVSTSKASGTCPSVDRIDNSKGYVVGNIIVVSLRANMLKRDATLDELQKLATFYTSLATCLQVSYID